MKKKLFVNVNNNDVILFTRHVDKIHCIKIQLSKRSSIFVGKYFEQMGSV